MARKRTDTIKLQLRLPEGLRRRIERSAENNKHSMNSEILARLEGSFRSEDLQDAVRGAAAEAVDKAVAKALGRQPDERLEWTDNQGRPASSAFWSNKSSDKGDKS